MRSRRGSVLLPVVLVLAALAAGAWLLTSGDQGNTVRAEFSSARGLLPNNDVRIGGAVAGSVRSIDLTERGTALVTLDLHDGLSQARADATAAIRPVDLLGDTYVSLDLGTRDAAPLHRPIPLARTSNAPRLSDVLNAFRPGARGGLQALLVELGVALDSRGPEFNRTAIALRPAIRATDQVLGELSSQNADLSALVADAQRVTGQVAPRDRELRRLVGAFADTLAATAAHTPQLDRGLAKLPPTLEQATGVARALEGTAVAAEPLARTLGRAAPGLDAAARDLGPFLGDARRAVRQLRPVVPKLTALLTRGAPAFAGLAEGGAALRKSAPALSALMSALVPAVPKISEAFLVDFADQASEPGNQPDTPTVDPARRFWRGAAVFTCEAFGRPIEPGCFSGYLAQRRQADARARRDPGTRIVAQAVKSVPRPSGSAPQRAGALLDYMLKP